METEHKKRTGKEQELQLPGDLEYNMPKTGIEPECFLHRMASPYILVAGLCMVATWQACMMATWLSCMHAIWRACRARTIFDKNYFYVHYKYSCYNIIYRIIV